MDEFEGKFCVVRTYSAGVHVGVVAQREGSDVVLQGARRVWKWQGANTLHEIALRGVGKGSRVSEAVESILVLGAIEVIPCTPEATENLRGAAWS